MKTRTPTDPRGRVTDLSPAQLVLLVFAAFLTGTCQYTALLYGILFSPTVCPLDPHLLSNLIGLALTILLLSFVGKRENRSMPDAAEQRPKNLPIGCFSPTAFFLLLNAALFGINILSDLLGFLAQSLYRLVPPEPGDVRFQTMQLVGFGVNLALLLLGLLLALFVIKQASRQASTKDKTPSDKENEP